MLNADVSEQSFCSVFIGVVSRTYATFEDMTDSVPKRRNIKLRSRNITQIERTQYQDHITAIIFKKAIVISVK